MLRKSIILTAGSALMIGVPAAALPPAGDGAGGIFAKAPKKTGKAKKTAKEEPAAEAQQANSDNPAPAADAPAGTTAAPSSNGTTAAPSSNGTTAAPSSNGTTAVPPANGAPPAASDPPKPAECTADQPC